MTQLNELKNGEEGIIISFNGGQGLINKLNAMGVRTGKKVTVISDSFIGGPVTIKIDTNTVSIGHGMASRITMEVER